MSRPRRWLKRNLDVMAFAAALMILGSLMAWWSVLVRRNISTSDALLREQITANFTGEELTRRVTELDAHTSRMLFMIVGETATACVLMLVLTGVLFAVARYRRRETQRLSAMLQLSAHQLKTPLAGVRALLQSLGNGAIPEELRGKFIGQGLSECDRLEHLIETTLAYQRAVAWSSARKEDIAASRLVTEIVEHRRATFSEETVDWRPGTSVTVNCDKDAVRVVLENLLDNARKYGGGKVELSDSTRGARWRLEVKDAGKGFETRDAERLFEPFERVQGTGVDHGSGLGLYISRQLARQMKGELTAVSAGPGQGSVFALELPLAKELPNG
jgi:signal transduction histidine kinase